jgi:hypothetical protein
LEVILRVVFVVLLSRRLSDVWATSAAIVASLLSIDAAE